MLWKHLHVFFALDWERELCLGTLFTFVNETSKTFCKLKPFRTINYDNPCIRSIDLLVGKNEYLIRYSPEDLD